MANWGYYSRVGSKHSSPQFLFLCVFFAVCTTTALGRGVQTCNKGEEEACNVDDSSSNWLSDARMWNPGHKASQVSRSVLNSWCNDTIQDAARRVLELEADMSVLKREILSCQGALVEKEKEWRDADSQLRLQFLEEKLELRRSCVEKELSLRVKHSAERNAVAADLAHCQAMRQAMIGAEECTYQKQAVLALCEAERDFYAAKLGVQKEEPINQHSEEKIQVGSCEYSLTEHQTRVRSLEERLGNCRFERAQAHAVVETGPEVDDAQVDQLRRLVRILSTLLVLSGILCLGLAAALGVWVVSTVKGERGQQNSKLSTAMLGSYPQVLSSEEAYRVLSTWFEENRSDLSSILTCTNCMFMLVPLTLGSSRKFALFGGGGEFTRQVEVAQDLAAHQLEKRLLIVLYEAEGYAFTKKSLSSIGLSAEKLAFEAVPKDQDFPSDDDVLVLWISERHGLQVSDSGGESELSEVITKLPWAHYLGMRAKV
uniref:Uncharacterized protein n=1 Tax=Physcomitrium patens TaxID=3218 RepID=A0A7I4B0Q3_PHYPA